MTKLKFMMLALLVAKLAFGAVCASYFLYALFLPFLNLAASGLYANPWEAAINAGIPKAFPYGPVMFYLMYIPRMVISPFVSADIMTVTWLHLLAARIPLLVADAAVLFMLVRFLDVAHLRAMTLWWASPIVLYVSYVHGQLDIIPTALLVGALILLVRGQALWAAVVLGLGLATKTHLVVALPFMAVYVARNEKSSRRAALFAIAVVATYLLVLFPWILSEPFRAMVFGSDEQGRLFKVTLDYPPGVEVYLAPLAIGFLFLRFATYRKVNRDTLFMFLGLAFTVMISLLPAAHGYYIWPLPFVIYFFAREHDLSRVPLWAFNISVLAYLILGTDSTLFDSLRMVLPQTATLGAPLAELESRIGVAVSLNSLLFTATQASILTVAFMMYRHGVQSNIIYRPKARPLLIGIGGDSGTGKHTMQRILSDLLEAGNVMTVHGDDVHRWERGHEMWRVVSPLNPQGNDLYLQLQYARALGQSRTVSKVRYDHTTGTFTEPEEVSANRFIMFVGLHPFYLKRMRELIDIKIYMDTDEELRLAWKLERDVRDRGYTPEQVVASVTARSEDAATFIRPQKQFADIVVRYSRSARAVAAGDMATRLAVSVRLDNSLPLHHVADALARVPTLAVRHTQLEDLQGQELFVDGEIAAKELQQIGTSVVPQINELLGAKPHWHANHAGIVQLCFLLVLSDSLLNRSDFIGD